MNLCFKFKVGSFKRFDVSSIWLGHGKKILFFLSQKTKNEKNGKMEKRKKGKMEKWKNGKTEKMEKRKNFKEWIEIKKNLRKGLKKFQNFFKNEKKRKISRVSKTRVSKKILFNFWSPQFWHPRFSVFRFFADFKNF